MMLGQAADSSSPQQLLGGLAGRRTGYSGTGAGAPPEAAATVGKAQPGGEQAEA